jgi:hypothetical protein
MQAVHTNLHFTIWKGTLRRAVEACRDSAAGNSFLFSECHHICQRGLSGLKLSESCWLSQTSDISTRTSHDNQDVNEFSSRELELRPLCRSDLYGGGESAEVSGVDYIPDLDAGFGPEAFKHSFDFMFEPEYENGLKGDRKDSRKADLMFFSAISRLLKLSSFLRQWKSVVTRTEENDRYCPNQASDSVHILSDDAIHKQKSRGKSADILRIRLSEVMLYLFLLEGVKGRF